METIEVNSAPEILHHHLLANFRHAFHHFWQAFLWYYAGIFTDVHKRVHYAKSHALIDAVIAAIVAEIPAEVIFQCYRRFILTDLSFWDEIRLNTADPIYFWSVIRNCRHFGIAETIVHMNCDPHADLEKARFEIRYELLRLELNSKSVRSKSPELSRGSGSSAPLPHQLEKSPGDYAQVGGPDRPNPDLHPPKVKFYKRNRNQWESMKGDEIPFIDFDSIPSTLQRSPSRSTQASLKIARKKRLVTTQPRAPKVSTAKMNIRFKPMPSR